MVTDTKIKMTPEQATSFNRVSIINASIVSHSLSCGCQPYQDVFTYNRWLAQGYQVQRGEHSLKLGIIKEVERETDNGETELRKIFGNAHVFCRHQVKPIDGKQGTSTITPAITPTIKIEPVKPIEPINTTPIADNDIMKGWELIK